MPARLKKSHNGSSPNGTHPRVFDLGTRKARDAVEVVIYDPLDPGAKIDTGIRIGIKSMYSREARAAAQASKAKIQIVDDKVVSSEAELDESFLDQTIGATTYWFHADLSQPQRKDGTWAPEAGYEDVLLIDGERLPCTPEAVRKLYTDPDTAWIQRPVQARYLDLAGFFETPKTA